MRDEELLNSNSSIESLPPPPSSGTYRLLVRPSKKLGTVATKAYRDLKNILNYEIPLPPAADHLLDELRLLKPKTMIDKQSQKLVDFKKAVTMSHEVLTSAHTIAIFSDSIVVDRSKITIVKRSFFWTADVISIQIEDVLNVAASVGPLFGSLTIASRVMSTTDHFRVSTFWRNDVIDLKRIIQGYVIAKQSGLDTSQLSKEEMLETLREIGHDSGSM